MTSIVSKGPAARLRTAAHALPLAAGILVLALAPARADVAAKPAGDASTADPTSLAGEYLAGRFAAQIKALPDSARYYGEALRLDPLNPFLIERTFVLRLAIGQIEEALPLARSLVNIDPDNRTGHLLLAIEAVKEGRYADVRRELKLGASGPLDDLVNGLLGAWSYYGQGNVERALRAVDALSGEDWYGAFKAYHGALIADAAGRSGEAVKRIEEAYKDDPKALRVVEAYAVIKARAGAVEEAATALESYLAETADHPRIADLLERVRSEGRLPPFVGSASAGAAEVAYGLGSAVGREGSDEIGAIYLQLARYLDPDLEIANFALAELYQSMGMHEEAIALWKGIPESSSLKRSAEIQIGLTLDAQEKVDEAIAHLKPLVEADPADLDAVIALGNILRVHKRFEEAAAVYGKGIDTIESPTEQQWVIYYFRGICFERSKHWEKAEADFKMALKLRPDQPLVLNYLGYSWVDQGVNLHEGLEMIRKAVDLRPSDGYIVDSLGWAYYRLGRYQDAVDELEKAISLKPQDPVINDHLGDAYWRVGRKLEARFQWNHALSLDPEPEDAVKIREKLASGLPDEPATNAAAADRQTETPMPR